MDVIGSSESLVSKDSVDINEKNQAFIPFTSSAVEPLFKIKASWSQAGIGTCFVLDAESKGLRIALDLGWCVFSFLFS